MTSGARIPREAEERKSTIDVSSALPLASVRNIGNAQLDPFVVLRVSHGCASKRKDFETIFHSWTGSIFVLRKVWRACISVNDPPSSVVV